MKSRIDLMRINPGIMHAMLGLERQVHKSGLEERLLNLVRMRASQINGCAYCLDLHTRDLTRRGVKVEKLALAQAWREAGAVFDERERAALAWAETVTRVAETAIPDAEFQAVSAVFGEKEIVDLTIAIGLMNTYNRIAIGLRRPPEAALAASA